MPQPFFTAGQEIPFHAKVVRVSDDGGSVEVQRGPSTVTTFSAEHLATAAGLTANYRDHQERQKDAAPAARAEAEAKAAPAEAPKVVEPAAEATATPEAGAEAAAAQGGADADAAGSSPPARGHGRR